MLYNADRRLFMKYQTYEEYVEAAKNYYSSKKDLKIPVEYMIFSKDMFELFNGNIQFGAGCCESGSCENCTKKSET